MDMWTSLVSVEVRWGGHNPGNWVTAPSKDSPSKGVAIELGSPARAVHAPNRWAISVAPCLLLLLPIASGTHVLWRTGPALGRVILDTDVLGCLSISLQQSSSCVPQPPVSAAIPMEILLMAHSRSHFLSSAFTAEHVYFPEFKIYSLTVVWRQLSHCHPPR